MGCTQMTVFSAPTCAAPRRIPGRGEKPLRAANKGAADGGPFACLLDLDLRAGLFELRLDLIGLLLRNAFLDRVRRSVDKVLGLLQAEARDRADDLDRLDLLVAGVREHDVEGGLLLLG